MAGKTENESYGDALRLAKSVESAEVERRISKLEESFKTLSDRQHQRHTTLITIIFGLMAAFVSAVSLSVAILAAVSRYDTQKATEDMKTDAREAVANMQDQFKRLAGDALKQPKIEITVANQAPLNGQKFIVNHPMAMPFFPMFLKNVGDKRTETLSFRIFFSEEPGNGLNNDVWERVSSNDKDYPISYYARTRIPEPSISPAETWTFEQQGFDQVSMTSTNMVNCKIQVFYGGERPAEAFFQMTSH